MERENIVSPGQIMDMASAYWKSCTLHAGVKLGLFNAIGTNAATADGLADRLGLDRRGTATLLNALTAMGLLAKENGNYRNTDIAVACLTKSSGQYLGDIIMHHHHLVDGWNQLDSAVRTGHAVDSRTPDEEQERQSFLLGMHNIAMGNAPRLSGLIDLDGHKKLLDLGGGPGTYAIHFCLANPHLSATIFDRPTTEPYARKIAQQFRMDARIAFVAGDFTTDPLPGGHDVAWLSQILHSNGPEACQTILNKTAKALMPGGLIMIHEFYLNDTLAGPLFPALFSLNMLLNNGEGRSYSAGQIGEMLDKAGFTDIQRHPYQGPNDAYVLCARKEQ